MAVGRRIAAGDVVAGYEVGALVGRGGMGEVYRAHDLRLERPVALKLLSERLSDDDGFRERMLRESRLAASLDHPNVVPIYEAGEADGPALHRDAVRRRDRPQGAPASRGRADAGACRGDRGAGRRRARRRAREGPRPPRREAVQRPARPAGRPRARVPRGLRADAERRRRGTRGREPDGHRRLRRARADPRRPGRRTSGRLRARLPALRDAHRNAAVHRVVRRRGRLRPPGGGASARRASAGQGVPAAVDDVLARAMAKDPDERPESCARARRRGESSARPRAATTGDPAARRGRRPPGGRPRGRGRRRPSSSRPEATAPRPRRREGRSCASTPPPIA